MSSFHVKVFFFSLVRGKDFFIDLTIECSTWTVSPIQPHARRKASCVKLLCYGTDKKHCSEFEFISWWLLRQMHMWQCRRTQSEKEWPRSNGHGIQQQRKKHIQWYIWKQMIDVWRLGSLSRMQKKVHP